MVTIPPLTCKHVEMLPISRLSKRYSDPPKRKLDCKVCTSASEGQFFIVHSLFHLDKWLSQNLIAYSLQPSASVPVTMTGIPVPAVLTSGATTLPRGRTPWRTLRLCRLICAFSLPDIFDDDLLLAVNGVATGQAIL